MSRFLVPLDGSELAEHALPWAVHLAEKFGAQVELLRCYEPLASVYMLPEFAAPAPVYFDQSAVHEQIESYLKEQADSLPQGLVVQTRAEGDAGSTILDRADDPEVSTIVIASHGRGGIGRWLLGSVTTKVVRGSTKPVLVISSHTEVPAHPKLERILLPLDGSETSEAAISKAVELAQAFDAEIVLYRGVPFTPIGDATLDTAVKLELAHATEYLQAIQKKHPEVKTRVAAEIAGPNLGILKKAEECDLVVMSSHGRSGVQRWLLGSVAERVIQEATKPVLIVYKRDEE